MWFRNLHLYQLSSAFQFSAENFAEKLTEKKFVPCSRQAEQSVGWVSPIHRSKDYLVHAGQGCILFCMRREQKVIPASAVKEALEERVYNIQEETGRKVYAKEKQSLKEDILSQMLPNAFTRSTHTFGYIDTKRNYLVIDCASESVADLVIELMVETIGSFGAIKLVSEANPSSIMQGWLENGLPEGLVLSGDYELKDPQNDRVAKFKDNDEKNLVLGDLLDDGYAVEKLGVYFQGQFKGLLLPSLQVKSIKFMDELLAENDNVDHEDQLVKFDADFVLMTRTLGEFINQFKDWFKVSDHVTEI